MVKFIKQTFVILALLCYVQAYAEPVEGKDYTVINPAQPTSSGNKIEVLEFFFYGCSHCFNIHPLISAWEKKIPKDVQLTYVPTIFNDGMESMARTYYALETLGKLDTLHDELFNAWNVQKLDLRENNKAINFVAQQGIDRKKFSDAFNAFSMQSKVMRSKQMAQSYNIRGTPTLIVDGKYMVAVLGPADSMRVMADLVDKVRKERASGKR